jgi:membrane protein YdbS with pleckstrin-like domain
MKASTFLKRKDDESGFGIWGILILLVLIGFIVAAAMKWLSVLAAVIGFIIVFGVIIFLAMLPDLLRYTKISSM